MKKFLLSLFLLLGASAHAGPPLTWGPDNKVLLFQGGLDIPQVASPSGNPTANYNYVYPKSDNKLYIKSSAGVETLVGPATGGSGDVVGPASATDTAVALFNGATGKLIQNSAVTVVGSTITASLAGNATTATTATNATNVATTSSTTNASFFPLFVASSSNGNQAATLGTNLTFNPSTNTLSVAGTGLYSSTSGTETTVCGMSSGTRYTCNNSTHAGSTFLTYATNTGYLGIGVGTFSNDWYISMVQSSSDTAPLTNLIPNTGTYPILVLRNSSSTTNNYAALGFSGSTDKLTSFIYGVTTNHSGGSETGDLHLGTSTAGTKIDDLILRAKGQITHVGTAPAAGTCGTSPGTPTGSDNAFKIVAGTGGVSGSCAITLTQAPTTDGKCACEDETSNFFVKTAISGSTMTMTTFAMATGLASNFTASDVFKCVCHYW